MKCCGCSLKSIKSKYNMKPYGGWRWVQKYLVDDTYLGLGNDRPFMGDFTADIYFIV